MAVVVFEPGHQLGIQLCEMLGLDPNKTRDVSLHFPLDGVATATVEQIVGAEQVTRVLQLLKSGDWREQPPEQATP